MAMRINTYTVQLVKEKGGLYDLAKKIIRSPYDGVDIVNEVLHLDRQPNEHFVIATLTTKNAIAGLHVIHKGTLNASIVHPREVFAQAILNNAASIICFHNHPSGDPSPSREDIEITKRLKDCGELLGIEVMDHLIIGDGKFISLKEKGYI
jgi:DNA repair protein RadC